MRRVPRWLGVNALIAVTCAVVAYVVVWLLGVAGLRAAGVDPVSPADYIFGLVFVAMAWPVYMLALAVASWASVGRFRWWAFGLLPLLALFLGVLNLVVTMPEIQATYGFYLLFAATVRPLAEAEHDEPRQAPGAHAQRAG